MFTRHCQDCVELRSDSDTRVLVLGIIPNERSYTFIFFIIYIHLRKPIQKDNKLKARHRRRGFSFGSKMSQISLSTSDAGVTEGVRAEIEML